MTNPLQASEDRATRVAEAMRDLDERLTRQIASLRELRDAKTRESEQARLAAKIRGAEIGLAVIRAAIAPSAACWDLERQRPEVAREELPGFDLAVQDAREASRL